MRDRWADLLELAEQIMALPCSRAWLDLQRFVVEACTALGDNYNAIAVAIRSELRTLLRDLPQLLDAALTDDTPAANSETQNWLRELLAEPSGAPPLPGCAARPRHSTIRARRAGKSGFVDPQALAQEAMRIGPAAESRRDSAARSGARPQRPRPLSAQNATGASLSGRRQGRHRPDPAGRCRGCHRYPQAGRLGGSRDDRAEPWFSWCRAARRSRPTPKPSRRCSSASAGWIPFKHSRCKPCPDPVPMPQSLCRCSIG